MLTALSFAVVLPSLLVAHNVADHLLQTHRQATHKGLPGWVGRLACARHVATYTACTAATVSLLWWLFDLPITPLGFLAGQLVSAGTHYWADRRTTLERLANWGPFARMGKGEFYRLGAPRKVSAFAGMDEVRLYRADTVPPVEVSWDNPSLGSGAYALDQAWHWLWLFVAALVTALV
jgi:hypothetical protein